jgi:hypothetical protein
MITGKLLDGEFDSKDLIKTHYKTNTEKINNSVCTSFETY